MLQREDGEELGHREDPGEDGWERPAEGEEGWLARLVSELRALQQSCGIPRLERVCPSYPQLALVGGCERRLPTAVA